MRKTLTILAAMVAMGLSAAAQNNTDRIGTLYFNGYVVTTLRTEDGETVTAVVPN